jgi:hypothetical protein
MSRLGSTPAHPPAQFETCAHCNGRLLWVDSCLHVASGKIVRAFKCSECNKLTWDD